MSTKYPVCTRCGCDLAVHRRNTIGGRSLPVSIVDSLGYLICEGYKAGVDLKVER